MKKKIIFAVAALLLIVMAVIGIFIGTKNTSRPSAPERTARYTDEQSTAKPGKSSNYVINENTGKFHYDYCSGADDIRPENRREYNGSRDELIDAGFKPCNRCNP